MGSRPGIEREREDGCGAVPDASLLITKVGSLLDGVGTEHADGRCFEGRGFTLLELIVVMSVLAILLSAVLPVFLYSMQTTREERSINALVSTMKYAQERAITDSVEYRFYLDPEERTFWLMRFDGLEDGKKQFVPTGETYGQKQRLAETMKMEKPEARLDREAKAYYVAFYPSGACDYATVILEPTDIRSLRIKTKGRLGQFEIDRRG
jgi:prepilin-type N-terminal cleavage/methylation domain-containing protein